MKSIIKKILPPPVLIWLKSFFSQWSGKYDSWESAQKDCQGYDAAEIFSKVYESAKKVANGEYPYERDSVIFDRVIYSWPLVTAIQHIFVKKKSLKVLDFGGGLGTSYQQNKVFLDSMNDVKWIVVEQEHLVKKGREEFEGERLKFSNSVKEAFDQNQGIDMVLISSTLQYLENPYEILQEIIDLGPDIILLDRLSLINTKEDWITKQTVPPSIYSASYPCRFFSREKVLTAVRDYSIFGEFECYVPNEGYLGGREHYQDVTLWLNKRKNSAD